jgi:hypothetical protein
MSQERHGGEYIVNVSGFFQKFPSYYDPLQVVMKNVQLNCIFSSTLTYFFDAFPQSSVSQSPLKYDKVPSADGVV